MLLAGEPVVLRTAESGDMNFCKATWLRSAKDASRIPRDRFFRLMRPCVEADLANGDVLVACPEDAPSTILGWACFRDGALRWGYVTFDLRRQGVFTFIREGYEQASQEAAGA
jgi:hypothetical protein